MRSSSTEGIPATVVEAVAQTLHGLTAEEREAVRSRLGVGGSTMYQWGEYDDQGRARRNIPAEIIPAFCAATGSDLVLRVVLAQTQERMEREAPVIGRRARVTQGEVMREAVDITGVLARALEDRILTDDERRAVVKEAREFLSALDRCEATEGR
jgi:hypothetical protein